MNLTQKQLLALEAICNTIIPSIVHQDDPDGYWKRKASDVDIPQQILRMIGALGEQEKNEFRKLLSILTVPILGMTWGGPLRGAQDLQPFQIERMLNRWANSLSNDLRNAFNKLKKICCLLYFGSSDAGVDNPNWISMDYPGPLDYPVDPNFQPLPVLDLQEDLEVDVVVVGSGAGGAVVAQKLSAKGYKVVVVEKGGPFQRNDYTQREVEMMDKLFEKKGLLTSTDGGVLFLAGSTLGGGTAVNWGASLRTPDFVLEEWAQAHQNPHFLDHYEKHFEFIEQRKSITSEISQHNVQNNLLSIALTINNLHHDVIPRNMKYPGFLTEGQAWNAEGYASLGDKYGIKQSVNETFLKDAVAAGASIVTNATVQKVLIENGSAVGVEVYNQNTHQTKTIRARKVVLAAGALHTPCILKKSGAKHREIGKNLYIHPAFPVPAVYDHKVEGWYGPMMSTLSESFAKLNGNFGFRIETPPVHAGLMGVANSWVSGRQFKEDMLKSAQTAVFLILIRDISGGSVSMTADGNLDIQYKLASAEQQFFKKALHEVVKLHRSLKAEEISVLHNDLLRLKKDDPDLDKFLSKISGRKWQPNYYTLFSAHQMGTCRMGGNTKKHPVDPTGKVLEFEHLYVADGSLFPSASGVNPMLSIQALASHVADQILSTL